MICAIPCVCKETTKHKHEFIFSKKKLIYAVESNFFRYKKMYLSFLGVLEYYFLGEHGVFIVVLPGLA
jgi:hypothetical protein